MALPDIHKFPKEKLTQEEISALESSAKSARISALTMISAAKSGHPAGAFSSMEMFMSVYGVDDLTP